MRLAAAIACFVLVSCARPADGMLLRVCWDRDGNADYGCSRPRALAAVSNVPAKVRSETSNDPLVGVAIAWWNSRLGFRAFVVAQDYERADVLVRAEWSPEFWHAGKCRHNRGPDGVVRAFVRLKGGMALARQQVTLIHELGHALGLGHDQPPRPSIMNPTLPPPGFDEPQRLVLRDDDVSTLRALHGPRLSPALVSR